MKITFGTASFDDHLGVRSTFQQFRIAHADVMDRVELLLVDNNPTSEHGRMNRDYVRMVQDGGHNMRYVTCDVVGTSPARNMVFSEASGEWVFCCDSHIELDSQPGSPHVIRRMFDWIEANPESRDLITGPALKDSLNALVGTHWTDKWFDGVWGQWGCAWECSCGFLLSPISCKDHTKCTTPHPLYYVTLAMPQREIAACPQCGKVLPVIGWSGHDKVLIEAGYRPRGLNRDDEPFEIPACGLGLFGCHKDAWLRFPAACRGWGGEEYCIHEKYRQAGQRTICLPFLRWSHRYGNPYKHADVRTNWDKVRNYVIWHHELGLPLDRVREAYPTLPAHEWAQLTANPANPPEWPAGAAPKPKCEPCGASTGAEQIVQVSTAIPHDRHHVKLGELIEQVGTVIHLSRTPMVAPCDMLVVDACRGGVCLDKAFKSNQMVRRYIAIIGTSSYGMRAEDGGPGIWPMLSNFLNPAHEGKTWKPVWWSMAEFPMFQGNDGAGMVVLSREPGDWPADPVHFQPPRYGVGTELMDVMKEYEVDEKPGCDCRGKANAMDMHGIAWCKQNHDFIVSILKEGAPRWSWTEKLAIAAKAVVSGKAFKLNPLNPLSSLLTEAIRRAESKRDAKADVLRQAGAA